MMKFINIFILIVGLFFVAKPVCSDTYSAPDGYGTEHTVNVSTVKELMAAIDGLESDTTISISPGIYDLGKDGHSLVIDSVKNVAIRGATGNRDDVVLKGQGMSNKDGSCPIVIHINNAQNVLVADITIRDAWYHLIQVHGENGAQNPHLYNLRLVDSGEQFIKSCCGADNGIVEQCLFEFTNQARWYYSGGIDVLDGDSWIVKDNIFKNIKGLDGQLTLGGMLFWHKSRNTIVERNQFYECDMGVAFGNPSGDNPDHFGGIIRNNMFYRKGEFGDAAITLIRAVDVKVLHNTLVVNNTFPWVIDYRYPETSADIKYNITDGRIYERDGAAAEVTGNITSLEKQWFRDFENGDLHLRSDALACINKALFLNDVVYDFDDEPRAADDYPDIGADEYIPDALKLAFMEGYAEGERAGDDYSACALYDSNTGLLSVPCIMLGNDLPIWAEFSLDRNSLGVLFELQGYGYNK